MSKILVVDDNPDMVELIGSRLEISNYEVITAASGEEALLKAVKEKPDLVLLDVSMSGIDGFETGQRLKADPATRHIPIIMVTAKGENADLMRAVNVVKAAGYVVKPFRPDQLLEKVAQALKKT